MSELQLTRTITCRLCTPTSTRAFLAIDAHIGHSDVLFAPGASVPSRLAARMPCLLSRSTGETGVTLGLGSACWMSAASEQASRNVDVLLPVCRRLGIGFMVTGGGRAGHGGRDQLAVGRRGSWRSAGEKFSQVAGVRDACSHVVRMAGPEPG